MGSPLAGRAEEASNELICSAESEIDSHQTLTEMDCRYCLIVLAYN